MASNLGSIVSTSLKGLSGSDASQYRPVQGRERLQTGGMPLACPLSGLTCSPSGTPFLMGTLTGGLGWNGGNP